MARVLLSLKPQRRVLWQITNQLKTPRGRDNRRQVNKGTCIQARVQRVNHSALSPPQQDDYYEGYPIKNETFSIKQ